MLRLVIAIVIALVSVQCAAACTPVAGAPPACHHHKQAPACSHELVPATIVQASIALSFSSEPAGASIVAAMGFFQASAVEDPSPPDPHIRPHTILRI